MTRQVADTSREAYANIKNLSDKQQEVLEAIEVIGEATNYQIALYLRWEINRVTGRVTELRKLGKIELAGKRTGQFNVKAQVWRIADDKPEGAKYRQPSLLEVDCGDE